MKPLKKLICIFSFALFALMLGMAPQQASAEELSADPDGQALPETAQQAEQEENVPSAAEETLTPAEEQAAAEQETPSAAEETLTPAEEQTAAEQGTPSADAETTAPAEEQATAEQGTPSADAETTIPAEEEQVQPRDVSLLINPSVYIDEKTGMGTAFVTVMFNGVKEAFINVRLQQLRDGEWITLGAGMHFTQSSPAYQDYTRTWPVDSGYYYRSYVIVELYDADGNIVHEAAQESVSIYY